jgi:hypothetical protein
MPLFPKLLQLLRSIAALKIKIGLVQILNIDFPTIVCIVMEPQRIIDNHP